MKSPPLRDVWQQTLFHTITYQHHHCSGNTTNMCQTGIRHRSSNTRCKEKLQRWKKWMLIVSWQCCYMYLYCLELLRQAHETGKQPATRDIPHWVHSITRLRYHYMGISELLQFTCGDYITMTCYLWAPTTSDHCLHVVSPPGRHITSFAISLKFYDFIIHTLTSSFLQVRPFPFGSRQFNGGCCWEGLMVFLSSCSTATTCYRYLHHFELLRQAQEKDGNLGHWTNGKATGSELGFAAHFFHHVYAHHHFCYIDVYCVFDSTFVFQ